MTLSLQDVSNFFNKLQSYTVNNDGILNQPEAESAYKTMQQQAGDQIPQEIKDKFKDGGLNADAFNSIDPLGVKDGYINDQELFKSLSSGQNSTPYTPPVDTNTGQLDQLDKAGYAVYRDGGNANLNSKDSAKKEISDIEGILGSANDNGTPNGELTKNELDHAITLTQGHKDTITNADAKLALMEHMSKHFTDKYDDADGSTNEGKITTDTLAREIQVERSSAGQLAS